jgi:AbrB family looped-hinge helix DNA binding protein
MQIVKVSEGGRVVIPAELRQKHGIAIGDSLLWVDTGDGVALVSTRNSIRRAQAIVAGIKRAGVDEVEAFLIDKRKEAQRE